VAKTSFITYLFIGLLSQFLR
jgi:hypothetical protein